MVEARELVSMPNVRAFGSASQVPLLFSIRIRHPGSSCEPGGALAIVQLGEPLGDVPFSERINEHHPLSTNGWSVCAGSGTCFINPMPIGYERRNSELRGVPFRHWGPFHFGSDEGPQSRRGIDSAQLSRAVAFGNDVAQHVCVITKSVGWHPAGAAAVREPPSLARASAGGTLAIARTPPLSGLTFKREEIYVRTRLRGEGGETTN